MEDQGHIAGIILGTCAAYRIAEQRPVFLELHKLTLGREGPQGCCQLLDATGFEARGRQQQAIQLTFQLLPLRWLEGDGSELTIELGRYVPPSAWVARPPLQFQPEVDISQAVYT